MEVWAGVYDALGARLAVAAGYDALWLSSYSLSATRLGMPDEGHVTPEQLTQVTREIAQVVDVPIVVDGENGWDCTPTELQDVVRQLEDAGARGICIEDTIGPKQCSLWDDIDRDLRDADEMVELLIAVNEAMGADGRVISRTESLIEGHGVEAAVERVRRYATSGCWGHVIHFRDDIDEVFQVAAQCRDLDNLVIIPTKAPEVSFEEAEEHGFGVYMVANVAVRAAASAIERSLSRVQETHRLADALEDCMPLKELDARLAPSPST
jgi:phosphoenolpyruvate phosphomutase